MDTIDSRQKYDSDTVEIDLGEIAGLLAHRALLIILCAVLAALIGFSISKFVVIDLYESTTSVYILNKQDSGTITYSDVQLGTQLTKDYAELITSRYVIENVIEKCGLDTDYERLYKRISVETPTDTRILEITVTDEDPAMAQYIANEIRTEAAEHITNVMDIQAVNVVDEANLPERPSSPNVLMWTLAGLLLGAFISIAAVIVKFILDDTIKTSDDVEKYLGLSTLGLIPIREEPGKAGHRKSVHSHDAAVDSEENKRMQDGNGNESGSGSTEAEFIEFD